MAHPYLALRPTRNRLVSHYVVAGSKNPLPLGMGSVKQGEEWLKENLPHAKVIEVSSTAEGAKIVSEGKDSDCAAIASAACADVYGLDILASSIQNNKSNKTRFYVLSLDEPATAQAKRLANIAQNIKTARSKDLFLTVFCILFFSRLFLNHF